MIATQVLSLYQQGSVPVIRTLYQYMREMTSWATGTLTTQLFLQIKFVLLIMSSCTYQNSVKTVVKSEKVTSMIPTGLCQIVLKCIIFNLIKSLYYYLGLRHCYQIASWEILDSSPSLTQLIQFLFFCSLPNFMEVQH